MGKLVSALLWTFSLTLLVWAILSGPPAAISTIRDLTSWQSALADPAARWTEELRVLIEPVPFAGAMPDWVMNIGYLVVLTTVILFYHHNRVVLESRRILSAATSGSLSAYESHVAEADLGDFAKFWVPSTGILGGAGVLHLGILAGALGIATMGLGAIVASGVLVSWMSNREERRLEAAREHDRQQTLQRERERERLVELYILRFKKNEQRKLMYAAGIVGLIVAGNFIYPVAAAFL